MTRLGFNFFPAYRRSGARLTYIAPDESEVHVQLPLNWTTRNYVGTIFGGSIYAAVDPIYMVMLLRRLGKGYIIWDKAASIRYLKPGKTTLYARFVINDAEVTDIRSRLEKAHSLEKTYTVHLTDAEGEVHATVEKVLYLRKKSPHPKEVRA